jgi:hypothetical protein
MFWTATLENNTAARKFSELVIPPGIIEKQGGGKNQQGYSHTIKSG